MNRDSIYVEINRIFKDIFDDESIEVSDDTNADDIEDWDSLEQINILVAIEKKFNIKFTIRDVESLENVGQTVDLIERKIVEQ